MLGATGAILSPMDSSEARRARAAARASTPVVRVTLAQEDSPDIASLDRSTRIAMVWPITLDAWATSGRAMPDYDRAHAPGRILRGGRGED
jgi:hypothetical protein